MYLVRSGQRVQTLICTLFATCALLDLPPAEAHQCPRCDEIRCGNVSCVGGTTMDRCKCCYECARVVNETCGGQHGVEGTCDKGLVCVINPVLGSEISNNEVGFCKEIPSRREELSCNDVICDVITTSDCPSDSQRVVGHSHPNKCCPESPSCRCKPCPTEDPAPCEPGFVRFLKSEGSLRPGNCCDSYECIEHARYCDHILCDETFFFNFTCPDDSVSMPVSPTLSEDSCCPSVQNGCTCKPKKDCMAHDCPAGLQKRVRSLATAIPGSCCDRFDCINGSNPVCSHNNVIRSNGETWKLDECTNCTCRDGLTFCEPKQCPPLARCSWSGTREGECCPVCKGCVSQKGELHREGSSWQQDSCVTCQCEGGQVFCQAQFCAVTCSNPRTIPGQCCPECDDDKSHVTVASYCPLLSTCPLMCRHGYTKGRDGCYVCRCADLPEGHVAAVSTLAQDSLRPGMTHFPSILPEASTLVPGCAPLIGCIKQCSYGYHKNKAGCYRCRCNKCPIVDNCTKKCATGFVYNSEGCKLCKCLDSGSIETVPHRPTVDPQHCISVDGHRLEEGQMWWDGCRKCFCHLGQEMCALVACPAIRCANPVMRPGSCCPACGGEIAPPTSAGSNMCHSSDGRYFVDGETWQLDDCTKCICHQGSAICTIASCPPTLCHQPVILPHSCCPVCPDKSGHLPMIPKRKSPHFCHSISGIRYSNGDSWQVNACQSCTCHDGQIHCFSQTCPILRCNKTFLKKNQCCPMCMDDSAKYCTYGGNTYAVDETWLVDNCTRCVCSPEGQVLCMVTVCEPPKCSAPVVGVGACCAVCPNATESLTGDERLSGTNVTAKGENEAQISFNRSLLIAFITVVLFLVLIIILLLILLIRRRSRNASNIYNVTSKPPQKSSSFNRSTLCPKSTNLDFQRQNPMSISSGTASSKISSSSEHSLKMHTSVKSCNETKPSDSDESLLDKSFHLGCEVSLDDSIKLAEPCESHTTLDREVSGIVTAMDRLRIKHMNRRSAGDELEQTRHLLSATPSLGVTNNNRKSW